MENWRLHVPTELLWKKSQNWGCESGHGLFCVRTSSLMSILASQLQFYSFHVIHPHDAIMLIYLQSPPRCKCPQIKQPIIIYNITIETVTTPPFQPLGRMGKLEVAPPQKAHQPTTCQATNHLPLAIASFPRHRLHPPEPLPTWWQVGSWDVYSVYLFRHFKSIIYQVYMYKCSTFPSISFAFMWAKQK